MRLSFLPVTQRGPPLSGDRELIGFPFTGGRMKSLIKGARRFVANEDGAALVEYGLLIALIAVICVIVVAVLGNTVSAKFSAINANFK
jgi:pilus assembly protein Flp/PilA